MKHPPAHEHARIRTALAHPCFYVEDLEQPELSNVVRHGGALFRLHCQVIFNDYGTFPPARGRWAWAFAVSRIRRGQQALPIEHLGRRHHIELKAILTAVSSGVGIDDGAQLSQGEISYQLNKLCTDDEAAQLPEPPEDVLEHMERGRRVLC